LDSLDIDNLTVVRGRHTLKFGANVMRVRLNNSGNTITTQSLSYASTDDFVNNKASSPSYLQGEGVVGNRRFNPAAFSAPANGAWGNLGCYIANGPGAFEIDSSLQKRFHVTERVALNFRASAFNLLNHPEYKTPGASIGSVTGSGSNGSIKPSASFGRINGILNTGATGTGAPRRIEFQFRAEF